MVHFEEEDTFTLVLCYRGCTYSVIIDNSCPAMAPTVQEEQIRDDREESYRHGNRNSKEQQTPEAPVYLA